MFNFSDYFRTVAIPYMAYMSHAFGEQGLLVEFKLTYPKTGETVYVNPAEGTFDQVWDEPQK